MLVLVRYKCPDVVGHASTGDGCISTQSIFYIFCSHSIIFSLLGFLVKPWQLETLTLLTRTKFGLFGHDRDLIYPWITRVKWSVVWRLGLTFLSLGLFPSVVHYSNAFEFPIHDCICQEFSWFNVGTPEGNNIVAVFFCCNFFIIFLIMIPLWTPTKIASVGWLQFRHCERPLDPFISRGPPQGVSWVFLPFE